MIIFRKPVLVGIQFLIFFIAAGALAGPRFSVGGPNNFGVLVQNSKHTIYRSGALGRSGLSKLTEHLAVSGLPFPKTIISMNNDGYKRSLRHPTLFIVEEYEASKGMGFKLLHTYDSHMSTYLSGRNPYQATNNINQPKYLGRKALQTFGFDEDREIIGNDTDFFRILELVLTSEGPVLFHCTGGRHRTGMVAMAIRYIQGGDWLSGSYTGNSSSTKLNAAQYEYFLHNPFQMRRANFEFMEQLVKDPRFEALKIRFQEGLNAGSSST